MIHHLVIAVLALPALALLWLGVQALAHGFSDDADHQRMPGCGGCTGHCNRPARCEGDRRAVKTER